MREQVGAISPSAKGLDSVESLKCLLILILSFIVKQNENSGYACLLTIPISMKANLLLHSLSA